MPHFFKHNVAHRFHSYLFVYCSTPVKYFNPARSLPLIEMSSVDQFSPLEGDVDVGKMNYLSIDDLLQTLGSNIFQESR